MRALFVLTLLAAPGAWAGETAKSARPVADQRPEGAAAPDKAAPAGASDPVDIRCDGTNAAFFEELDEAQQHKVGYGETWDEHVCDQGVAVYAPGADGRWKDMRTPRSLHVSDEDQMLALVMPMAAVGGLGAIFLGAAALAAVSRLKRRVILEVPCPSCEAPLPIPVDDKSGHQMFCPMCGAACSVAVTGKGKAAQARVLR